MFSTEAVMILHREKYPCFIAPHGKKLLIKKTQHGHVFFLILDVCKVLSRP
jgi:hypothetical protein